MLQRIQTVYLIIAFLLSAVVSFLSPMYVDNGSDIFAFSKIEFSMLFGLSAMLSVVSLLSYKNRKQQFVLGRLNILIHVILLGVLVYRLLNLSGGPLGSVKGIGSFLPIVSIVCLALANKAIKRDEDLVKSVDRIR
ncbi:MULTISPECIES: DUF4293 domain-containing protein [Flavobacterium]|uniref:Transcription termination factor Rho n=1 Tax=Flavobacterium aurantiibacter TaxID=2023067 RepID=A0A255ZJ33_9FLAO|nr:MULTISPECIES: DUF4293 domain-containing protein [Flavobacterium]OYQ41496.1 hypothetical protein CHX27_13005 [Flavobacterium aurantiibacter]